jgi:hypothetical protein
MPKSFDAYHKWLGIPPEEQPAHHYRLIGISQFESDPDVIDTACDQRMAFLHQCAAGPHSAHSQRLLNEIAAARVCLLDAGKKARYDAALRARLERTGAAEQSAQPEGAGARLAELNLDGVESVTSLGAAGRSARASARRPLRWTWVFWLSIHAAVFYFGWRYLLRPALAPSGAPEAAVAARVSGTPAVGRNARAEEAEGAAAAPGNVDATAEPIDNASDPEPPPAVAADPGVPRGEQPAGSGSAGQESEHNGERRPSTVPAQLPPEVELPPVTDPTSVALGAVGQLGERNVELALESGAADLEEGAQIHVERGAGAARWTACLKVAGAEGSKHLRLADFLIQDESLRFQWHGEAGAAADQLRNCLVRLSMEPEHRTLALRGPTSVAALKLDLSSRTTRREMEIAAMPREEALLLEVTGLDKFPGEPSFEDGQRIAQLGRKDLTVTLDPRFGAELQIAFDRYSRGVALKVSPTFKVKGQQTELTRERVSNLRKQVGELPATRRDLSDLQAQASNLRAELDRLRSQRPNDLAQAAALRVRVANVSGMLGRTNKSLRSRAGRVQQLEQFDEGLPELEKLAGALDGSATLRYRVFAKTGEGELDLVRTDSDVAANETP